jgi:hypothetical protein
VGRRRGEGGENWLRPRLRPWKTSRKAVKFMKISRLSSSGVDFMNWVQKWRLKIKHLFASFGGKLAKKRGPQNAGISRHVDENKGKVFHRLFQSRQVTQK